VQQREDRSPPEREQRAGRGFDQFGTHHKTGTEFDPHGFDIYGYDQEGYDREGYDFMGYNRRGARRKE
jgi:hypothetical protein